MTFFTRQQQQLSACLAILAVLLLFVAPVVSQDLMARHSSAPPAQMMSHDADAMPMMHHMADPAHPVSGDEGFACGYCELLVHVPLMLWTAAPLIWLMLLIARAPPPPRVLPPLRRREHRVYRPRAPPAAELFTQDACFSAA